MKKLVLVALAILLFGMPVVAAEDTGETFCVVGETGRIAVKCRVSEEILSLSKGDAGATLYEIIELGFSVEQAVTYALGDRAGLALSRLISAEERIEQDATMQFRHDEPSNPFYYGAHTVGKRVNRVKLLADLAAYLNGDRRTITLEILKIQPRVTVQDLRERTALMAEFSTDYSRSGEGRRHNVELAAGLINGTVLLPGQTFSFNGVVGPRTAERGFAEANVILGGRYTPGIGGGVCQVSTTLYNAALRSGLMIVEARSHSLAPSYVPLSFDAMVSQASDMRFLNDADHPVYLIMTADGKTLTARLYGLLDRNYRTEYYGKTIAVIQPDPPEEVEDSTLPLGATVAERAINGYESEAYEVRIYADGRRETRKIRQDKYSAKRALVRRGTAAQKKGAEITDERQ